MKLFLKLVLSFTLLWVNIYSSAKAAEVNRIPVYPVPYVYPEAAQVKQLLDSVRDYYLSTRTLSLVNTKTGNPITNLNELDPNAGVSSGFANEWSYTHGVVLSAFEYITKVTGDVSYFSNNPQFFDFVLTHLPYVKKLHAEYGFEKFSSWGRIHKFHALDDCGSIGAAMIKTYLIDKDEAYRKLINRIDEHVSNNQYRLEDGTLARHRPQYQSIWADDLYMSVPFLANMGVLTGEQRYFDDAVKQILQMAQRLYIPEQELFDHGWSVTSGDYDPRFYWARANGWTLMAMAELLSTLPPEHQGREPLLHLYRSMIRRLANLQDGTGFWHNLLDKQNSFLETSATAMFTFAIAKGINEGWINHVYGPVAITGWNAITTVIGEDGSVDGTVEGTTFAHDNTYYFHRGRSIHATHGYGPVLYAGAEIFRLINNKKLDVQKARKNAQNSTFHFKLKSEWPNK